MVQLIIRNLHSSPSSKRWRTGVVLSKRIKKKHSQHRWHYSSTKSYRSLGIMMVFSALLLSVQLVVFMQIRDHQYELQEIIAASTRHDDQHQTKSTEQSIKSKFPSEVTGVWTKKPLLPLEWLSTNNDVSKQLISRVVSVAQNNPDVVRVPSNHINKSHRIVSYGDTIYVNNDWNSSPIVIEEYKLIFFTTPKIGCTVWLQLLRRMMHIKDWHVINKNPDRLLPWNPEYNGLSYLYDYNISYVNDIMTNPNWTRAIFIRDPKERFLSAYIDKVLRDDKYLIQKCCQFNSTCLVESRKSIHVFLQTIVYYCNNVHWKPQTYQMTMSQWSYINFIGHLDNIQSDSERLLRQLNAWDKYGSNGWGNKAKGGKDHIFSAQIGESGRSHGTSAKQYMRSYITKQLDADLNEYYAIDYNNQYMNLTKVKIY